MRHINRVYLRQFIQFIALLFVCVMASLAVPSMAKDNEAPPAVININSASVQILVDGLDGVGVKRAEAIVAWRESHGGFTSLEQLIDVKGIGESILNNNRDKLKL